MISKGKRLNGGSFRAGAVEGGIEVVSEDGRHKFVAPEFRLAPVLPSASFTLFDVLIGIDFHWERKRDQRFRGALKIKPNAEGKLMIINEVPVESYLVSVISSEMSGASHTELLQAHSMISRSWLLAQLSSSKPRRAEGSKPSFAIQSSGDEKQLVRWYDRENHTDFDVCADDHC